MNPGNSPSPLASDAGLAADLASALAPHGLIVRGSFVPGSADALPTLPTAARLWLVGVVGSGFWPHFSASDEYRDGQPDPLDRWSQRIGTALAQRWGGVALFPFTGPPWQPFQQWADRCEPTEKSAMGLRIHPVYGLWHAYRFALLLPDAQTSAPAAAAPEPMPATPLCGLCASCSGQPCLHTCPVDGYTASGFALEACASHLRTPAGQDCMTQGCRARAACPVGVEYQYSPGHAAFHMAAFLRSH